MLPLLALLAASPVPDLAQASTDVDALLRYDDGMKRVLHQLGEQKALFDQKATDAYTPAQKRTLLSAWDALFEYELAEESIRQRWWSFVQLPPTSQMHAVGFLLAHAALTSELAHGIAFANAAQGHAQMETLLDEPSAEFGVPPHAYSDFKMQVLNVAVATQLMTGNAYAPLMKPVWASVPFKDAAARLAQRLHDNGESARSGLEARGVQLFAGNAADILKKNALESALPTQTAIAEWLSHTRVHRQGKPLIARSQAEELVKKLEPGDILVARQNWFLSNIGLPGFWPHAELYLGSPPELAAYFDRDEEVSSYVQSLPNGAKTFSEYLKSRFPEKWRAYRGLDFKGEPVRVMEAISEGVSFTGIGHAMLVDYLGAMRPRAPKLEKAKALIRAFQYQGRPYDFEFDFFSDSALVCSELVFKSYSPSTDMKGLKLSLVDIAGRMTLPPTEFVKLYDLEFGKPDRQLDFVAFLDGREATGKAVWGDAESLRQTWKRPKWDVLQK